MKKAILVALIQVSMIGFAQAEGDAKAITAEASPEACRARFVKIAGEKGEELVAKEMFQEENSDWHTYGIYTSAEAIKKLEDPVQLVQFCKSGGKALKCSLVSEHPRLMSEEDCD